VTFVAAMLCDCGFAEHRSCMRCANGVFLLLEHLGGALQKRDGFVVACGCRKLDRAVCLVVG
jgi:hypothetical protein